MPLNLNFELNLAAEKQGDEAGWTGAGSSRYYLAV